MLELEIGITSTLKYNQSILITSGAYSDHRQFIELSQCYCQQASPTVEPGKMETERLRQSMLSWRTISGAQLALT